MRSEKHWFCRWMAIGLVVALAMPASESGRAMAQQETQDQRPQNASAQQGSESTTVPGNALPDSPSPPSSQARDQSGQESGSSQPQTSVQKPLGTAAAPYERTMGVAASRPAGAAIAPAKQKRVRTILISVGVIVGAGIAVGSVAALSHGSPSRP
jgi:hypothetical protein